MRTNFSRPWARALAVALAVVGSAAALAACGGSEEEQGSTASATTPSGKPIKIAIIADETNVGGVGNSGPIPAAESKVAAINAAGGIQGRPLELVGCDTKQEPNSARACAREAVAEDVVAVVGMQTTTEAQVIPVLEKAGIPAIGTVPVSPVAGESKIAFCFNGGVVSYFFGVAPALEAAGATKVSLIYPSNVGAASEFAKTSFEQGVEKTGLELGKEVGFNFGDTQFDAQVAAATEGDVDGLAPLAPGTSQAPLVQTVRQQAPEVKIATLTDSLTGNVLETLGQAAEGMTAVAVTQPATATNLPGIKELDADMEKYADPSAPRSDPAINAWAAVDAFEQVASDLPTITKATVMKAMGEVEALETGGIYPPLSASARGKSELPGLGCALNTSVVFEQVEEGELYALEPGKFYDLEG
jgi:branched-chain amino acid transport system substrate-binding protein